MVLQRWSEMFWVTAGDEVGMQMIPHAKFAAAAAAEIDHSPIAPAVYAEQALLIHLRSMSLETFDKSQQRPIHDDQENSS